MLVSEVLIILLCGVCAGVALTFWMYSEVLL